ncbi:MAG: glycerol-3-phosphate 1-O-acyltransferase PlsY [Deltaproteobacteria bacterium]|nr:glycerol-3-phosphate 1-O-acyltransferase PlsY [Deltaproteobacteria bacterium]
MWTPYTFKIIFIIFGYLLGSVPSGIIVAGFYGAADPRTVGSGNIGATNVGRAAGRGAGLITLGLDILKGAVPALAAMYVANDDMVVSLAGLSAVLGHLFPVFLRFRGGKGVATACGVFLVISPAALLLSALVFVFTVFITGFVSVGSMGAALAMPLCLIFLREAPVYIKLGFIIAALVIFKHRDNIKRIVKGQELPFKAP